MNFADITSPRSLMKPEADNDTKSCGVVTSAEKHLLVLLAPELGVSISDIDVKLHQYSNKSAHIVFT